MLLFQYFQYLEEGIIVQLRAIGIEFQPGEPESITILRDCLNLSYYFVVAFRGTVFSFLSWESILSPLSFLIITALHVSRTEKKNFFVLVLALRIMI